VTGRCYVKINPFFIGLKNAEFSELAFCCGNRIVKTFRCNSCKKQKLD
jgi:hypothetical protein